MTFRGLHDRDRSDDGDLDGLSGADILIGGLGDDSQIDVIAMERIEW